MPKWIAVTNIDDVPPGQRKVVDVDDDPIIIVNIDGTLYAIEDHCTHDGGTLSEGEIEDGEIICPRHYARFCLKTGAVTEPPAYEDIQSFDVKVEGGTVFIAIDN